MPTGFPDPGFRRGSAQPSVVVVDDDIDTLAFVCSALAMTSISAEGCPCTTRAMAYIRYRRPHIVLLNGTASDRNCLDLFQALRSDPATEMIAIVYVSTETEQLRTMLPVYDSGLVRFLPRPYPLDALVHIVARLHAGML